MVAETPHAAAGEADDPGAARAEIRSLSADQGGVDAREQEGSIG